MRVVFVTGFCNRVSALESRREGLNGGFVKAGSTFYRLIWPRNLATGAGLGCNPRNKKEKKRERNSCAVTSPSGQQVRGEKQRLLTVSASLSKCGYVSSLRGVARPAQAPVSAFQQGGQSDRACSWKHFSFFFFFYWNLKICLCFYTHSKTYYWLILFKIK